VNFQVLYSAAHAEFPDSEPLGGGKAVADYLIREWRRSEPFALSVLSSKSLGMMGRTMQPAGTGVAALLRSAEEQGDRGQNRRFIEAPLQEHPLQPPITKPLAQMTELEYARFCREFERAATAEILERDPKGCVVLSNDISEGPDFAVLGGRGYRIVTIFHVDVVEYFTRFYLRGLIRPETAARFRWFGMLPDVLRLVFQKQYQCVRHSARIVVPSAPMREMILRCYPWCAADKIVVLPWGNLAARSAPHPVPLPPKRGEGSDIGQDEVAIITLSRLSPEKGIERLLAALPHVDAHGKTVHVFICGGPAYMKGRVYERKLCRLAAKITTARVEFTGHVMGERKASLLQRADIFVSPSKHESYGLTIAEAQAAGCRVVSHHHYGAEGEVVDCSDARLLAGVLSRMIARGRTSKTGIGRREPTRAAEKLAALLTATSELPAERSRQ
jgi:glycosyltransferase involved in cell wall biosynthesis